MPPWLRENWQQVLLRRLRDCIELFSISESAETSQGSIGGNMARRSPVLFLAVMIVSTTFAYARKKKEVVPEFLLNAQTVYVVIPPDAGEPVTGPKANRIALDNVEKAILKWGRFRLVMDPTTADLVIAVRKGHPDGPTVVNSPEDNRPVTLQQDSGYSRIAIQRGRPPDVADPGLATSREPQVKNDMGHQEDWFEVYRGGIPYPLDTIPAFRLVNRDILDAPRVAAVEQFRKFIEDAEKERPQKH